VTPLEVGVWAPYLYSRRRYSAHAIASHTIADTPLIVKIFRLG
jgi:hypothetical protein